MPWGRTNRLIAVGAAIPVLALLSGCDGDSERADSGTSRSAIDQPASKTGKESTADAVTPSRCPAGVPSCRTAQGRITYVERVDPDGDGDAHFVIADPQGITLPGLTFIDVRKGLRPDPLPGIGNLVSAAGPVQTGSYGQSQIHALELHVAR